MAFLIPEGEDKKTVAPEWNNRFPFFMDRLIMTVERFPVLSVVDRTFGIFHQPASHQSRQRGHQYQPDTAD